MLEIKNIKKTYSDGYQAIESFNIDIKKGEFITLLGPSGCGKTTMLKMIAGFESPTSGKILFNKIDIKDLKIQRRPTSTVFQDYALFPNMTVKENIAYGLKLMRLPIDNLEKDISKEVEKKIKEADKKANNNLKSIYKKQENLKKELDKINQKIDQNENLKKLKDVNYDDYLEIINKIIEDFESKYNEGFYSSMPFNIKIKDFLNDLLTFFHFKKEIKFSYKKNKNDEKTKIIYDFLLLKKSYRSITKINRKILNLENYYNDLDYWVSYWQNYSASELEWYEKRMLTRKMTKQEIEDELSSVIKLVGLEGKENKYPKELSGGMQQRVALARAIVIKPDILLLDEPLSALDAKVKKQMQIEIKRLHKELGLTFILVTHDQEEALVLSDRIVVMSKGKIEQIGTPMEIYDKPSNKWIASFIGRANIIDSKIEKNNTVNIFGKSIKIDDQYKKIKPNTDVNIMIRPEDFDVVDKKKAFITAKVIDVIYKGLLWDVKCKVDDFILNIESINKIEINKDVHLSWDIEDMHIMEKCENE